MIKPDFDKYSLALIMDENIIHSSQGSGIRPLVECIKEFKGKISGCILHDKVIGLAAARLVIFSEMITHVKTNMISKSAKELLNESRIKLNAKKTVINILNNEKTGRCPMERKAEITLDNESFFDEVNEILFREVMI